jgi:hypothetical protein
MKRLLSMSILVAGLLLLAPATEAQECTASGLWALRGTYTFTGTAWQDLSEVNPALPQGYAPVSIIGAFTVNGHGDVTGWAHVNAGGLQMSAEFVNSSFGPPKADCSFPVTLSMKINEFGDVVTGPYSYTGVITGEAPAREIAFMMLGTGPGSHVEVDRARRISVRF